MRMSYLALLLVGCLSACFGGLEGPEPVTGDDDDAAPPAPVDLIVVVDNSDSAAWFQDSLGAALPSLFGPFDTAGVSLRFAVTTTDLDGEGAGNRGNLRDGDPPGTNPCGGAMVLESGAPDVMVMAQGLVSAGGTGSSTERGLEAAVLALCKTQDAAWWAALDPDGELGAVCASVPLDQRACNDGLLRAEAVPAILLVTDEGDEASPALPPEDWLQACMSGPGTPDEGTCRANFWSTALAEFGAALYVLGPTYQSTDNEVLDCSGAVRSVLGPCNEFGSPAAGIIAQQQTACQTGGEWWPLLDLDNPGDACVLADIDQALGMLAQALLAP